VSGAPAPGLSRDTLDAFARELFAATGPDIRRLFADPSVATEIKGDGSPVTRADREAEVVLRRLIARRFPDHGVIGEEHGEDRPDADFVWVLDPIDGTRAFVAGVPLFGTLIGLVHEGRPVYGALHAPVTGQVLLGDGRVTTLDGRPVRCRDTAALGDALVLAGNARDVTRHQPGPGWGRVVEAARAVRTWGDCFGYLLVASGRADVMVDPRLDKVWDRLPLLPLLEGAGARASGWDGSDAVTADSLVASAPALHEPLLEMLASR